MEPILSIVIPVFKTEKYLTACLESLKDLANFKGEAEIIVVSDASPGNPEEILDLYTPSLPISYLKHESNLGVFKARQTGITLARGKYILCLDSDDCLISFRWQTLFSFLLKEPADIIRYDFPEKKEGTGELKNKLRFEGTDVWGNFIKTKNWQLCGLLIKRTLFEKVFKILSEYPGSQYINMADDLCYSACLYSLATSFQTLPNVGGYLYRFNPNSLTKSHFENNREQIENICNDYQNSRNIAFLLLNNSQKKEFQYLLDSNIPWILGKLYKSFATFPELWVSYSNVFSRDKFFNNTLDISISTASEIVQFLSKKKTTKATKNIAIVVTKLQGGGTERMACSLANLLSDDFNLHLITSFKSSDDYPVSEFVEIHCIREDSDRRSNILKLCNEIKIDTLIFVDYYLEKTLQDILYFKFYNFNVIAQEHNSFAVPFYTRQMNLMANRVGVYKCCDLLTCLNQSDLLIWQSLGITRSVYMPNILTLQPTNTPKRLPQGIKKIVFLGRINPLKGSEDLLDIIPYVCSKRDDVIFEICGSFSNPSDEKIFATKLQKLIKSGRVIIEGQISAVEKKLLEATILILPSYVEGSPMVIGEARSVGTPTALYELPYVDISKNGTVATAVGKPLLLAEKLLVLLTNKDLYFQLSSQCFVGLDTWGKNEVKKRWLDSIEKLGKETTLKIEPAVKELCLQIQLTINFLNRSQESLFEDKDIRKKLKRYDRLLNIFNRFFPSGSRRRKEMKRFISCLASALKKIKPMDDYIS